ncbi:UNVERIFIED_CONTAM: protein HEAT INTOLERANT 4 [Sesamum calycinum]|uniref:Protein HEAT INTOLERANT 4 n=1 Tax=Sesamum calycinum TaxID=2727403 RepID=A0AAW2SVK9_9LAMI
MIGNLEDELEQSTVVQLLFPIDPKPEFTDKLIEEEELPADQKEAFKDFVKEKVREAKKANREAREARKKALAEMSEETKAAFENMRFYKFYPVSTPDTPDVSSVKLQQRKGFPDGVASQCPYDSSCPDWSITNQVLPTTPSCLQAMHSQHDMKVFLGLLAAPATGVQSRTGYNSAIKTDV